MSVDCMSLPAAAAGAVWAKAEEINTGNSTKGTGHKTPATQGLQPDVQAGIVFRLTGRF
jgi:hypothetical protein